MSYRVSLVIRSLCITSDTLPTFPYISSLILTFECIPLYCPTLTYMWYGVGICVERGYFDIHATTGYPYVGP